MDELDNYLTHCEVYIHVAPNHEEPNKKYVIFDSKNQKFKVKGGIFQFEYKPEDPEHIAHFEIGISPASMEEPSLYKYALYRFRKWKNALFR